MNNQGSENGDLEKARGLKERIGWILTVVYALGVFIYCCVFSEKFCNVSLADLGGFLSGAVGPLAFLWLVLGYLQQGDELRASSKELAQQAYELKMSVEQQAAMVKLQEKALDEQIARSHFQRQAQEYAAEPSFYLKYDTHENGMLLYNLTNKASPCSQVSLKIKAMYAESKIVTNMGYFGSGTVESIRVPGDKIIKYGSELAVRYQRSTGTFSEQSFRLTYVIGGDPVYRVEKIFNEQ